MSPMPTWLRAALVALHLIGVAAGLWVGNAVYDTLSTDDPPVLANDR